MGVRSRVVRQVLLRVLVLVGVLGVTEATAQSRATLRLGSRVRIWPGFGPSRDYLVGTVQYLERETITVLPRGAFEPLTVPFAALNLFERSRGLHPAVLYGLPATGLALGVWLGPIVFQESARCQALGSDDRNCGFVTPQWAIGAAIGTVVFLVGSRVFGRERWEAIPLGPFAIRSSVPPTSAWSVRTDVRFARQF